MSASKKPPFDSNFNPSNPFSWETAIITEVADVKPTVTGIDMKSISTPVQNLQKFKRIEFSLDHLRVDS